MDKKMFLLKTTNCHQLVSEATAQSDSFCIPATLLLILPASEDLFPRAEILPSHICLTTFVAPEPMRTLEAVKIILGFLRGHYYSDPNSRMNVDHGFCVPSLLHLKKYPQGSPDES
jgi:hypothetical protein